MKNTFFMILNPNWTDYQPKIMQALFQDMCQIDLSVLKHVVGVLISEQGFQVRPEYEHIYRGEDRINGFCTWLFAAKQLNS